MADLESGDRRWVVRDSEGGWVEVIRCATREEAIRRFCHPALIWDGFERAGWVCEAEPPGCSLGKASIINMEAIYDAG